MIRYRAAWVLPISAPPIRGGVVAVKRGVVAAVAASADGPVEDLGDVAVLPGLVNAHTHLELSWMRGRVPPSASMPAWAATLIAQRRAASVDAPEPIVDAIRDARCAGTSLVGDVSNTLASYGPLAGSALSAVVFRELLGFSAPDPDALVAAAAAQIDALPQSDRIRCAIAPHAPYSVSPALMQSIARHNGERPMTIHLGESAEEIEFLRDGAGQWRTLLETVGAWNPSWTVPACGPVGYLQRIGLVTPKLIAVHGVQLTDEELAALATARATLVTCPRSNRWTGAGDPPIDRFYASGVRVAIGTDSLASVADLNLFAEMAQVRRLAPSVPARMILESATKTGARALGFDNNLGTIEPGKRADLLAVRIPATAADVEEYLVHGIEPADIAWIDSEPRKEDREP